MTEQEILNLVVNAAKIRRRAIHGGVDPIIASVIGRAPGKIDIPDYYENYREMVDQYRHIEYHADAEIFPEDLFSKRSPNIGPDEERYVRENYKNNTQTVFLDFVNQFSRIFHDSNWSIVYDSSDDQKDSLQKYLEYGIFEFGSLENYMKSIACPLKVLDPNGVVAVKPLKFDFKYNEQGEQIINEDGTAALDNTLIEPQPVYYRIDQIVVDEFANHYLILTDEKSEVTYGNTKILAGLVYEFYDKNTIYKISQRGKPSDLDFDIKIYYQHDWGYIPVFKFKGVGKIKNSKIYYVSPFYFATHALDACLLNGANLQTATDNCAYPYRIMIGDECEYEYTDSRGEKCNCRDGYVYDSASGKEITCPGCNGTRLKSKLSPLGVMLLKSSSSMSAGDNVTATNAMAFVAPDPAILVFLREQIATDYNKGRQVLHLRTRDAVTSGPDPSGNTPSATGEVLDQKAQDSFIMPQSDQMFELYGNICEAIEWMRYGRDATFTLTKAKTFDFMSQSDYLKDISDKKAAGLPPSIINVAIQKFIDGSFWSETDKAKKLNLIMIADRIVSMNTDDIAFQISKNLIAPWEDILHESADYFIVNLMMENPKFFDQEIGDQKQQLIDAAKAKASEMKPTTQTTQLIDTFIQ